MTDGQNGSRQATKRRQLAGMVTLAVAGLLAAAGWYGWSQWQAPPPEPSIAQDAALLSPPDAAYLPLPEVTAMLADAPRVARLDLVLEAGRSDGAPVDPAAMQRLAEEVRRWVASQASQELAGAVALWTVRGRTLAIARELYPQLGVRDVIIKTLLVQ